VAWCPQGEGGLNCFGDFLPGPEQFFEGPDGPCPSEHGPRGEDVGGRPAGGHTGARGGFQGLPGSLLEDFLACRSSPIPPGFQRANLRRVRIMVRASMRAQKVLPRGGGGDLVAHRPPSLPPGD